jgi:hypothetical protein
MAVPANRLGFGTFTGFQLKIIQEAITLTVFLAFAVIYLKEKMAWNYAVSFALLIAAVVVAFAFKPVAAGGSNPLTSWHDRREQIDHKNDQQHDAVQDDGSARAQRDDRDEQRQNQ